MTQRSVSGSVASPHAIRCGPNWKISPTFEIGPANRSGYRGPSSSPSASPRTIWSISSKEKPEISIGAPARIGFYEAQRKEALMALESLRRALNNRPPKPPTP